MYEWIIVGVGKRIGGADALRSTCSHRRDLLSGWSCNFGLVWHKIVVKFHQAICFCAADDNNGPSSMDGCGDSWL